MFLHVIYAWCTECMFVYTQSPVVSRRHICHCVSIDSRLCYHVVCFWSVVQSVSDNFTKLFNPSHHEAVAAEHVSDPPQHKWYTCVHNWCLLYTGPSWSDWIWDGIIRGDHATIMCLLCDLFACLQALLQLEDHDDQKKKMFCIV